LTPRHSRIGTEGVLATPCGAPSLLAANLGGPMIRTRAALAIATTSLFLVPAFAAEQAHHWSYSGAGAPGHWAGMEKEFETCGIGKHQSPIDIRSTAAKVSDLPEIAFDYRPSPLKIIDNGHTVQVNYAPGSSITV